MLTHSDSCGLLRLPSPTISAFTRVCDALWGEGTISSAAPYLKFGEILFTVSINSGGIS
jgi:hypothetical protein